MVTLYQRKWLLYIKENGHFKSKKMVTLYQRKWLLYMKENGYFISKYRINYHELDIN